MSGTKNTGRDVIWMRAQEQLRRHGHLTHERMCEQLRLDPKQILDVLEEKEREHLVVRVGTRGGWRLVEPEQASPGQPTPPARVNRAGPRPASVDELVELVEKLRVLRGQRKNHDAVVAAKVRDAEARVAEAQALLDDAIAERERIMLDVADGARLIDQEIRSIELLLSEVVR